MERILTCLEQNDGRKAYLIFCDLDHLKEINDSFGHTAGDFAIESAAKRLKQVLPKDAITARIGGDEFVSLVLSDLPGFKDALLLQLEQAAERFNSNGQIPYYVEISTGIWEFYCEPQTDINELMNKSDELLYEAKKNRRRTICKYQMLLRPFLYFVMPIILHSFHEADPASSGRVRLKGRHRS